MKDKHTLRRLDEALQNDREADPLDGYLKTTGRRCRVYNTDKSDTDLDRYSRDVLKPKRKFGLWLLLLGLAALAGWYLCRQGVIPW